MRITSTLAIAAMVCLLAGCGGGSSKSGSGGASTSSACNLPSDPWSDGTCESPAVIPPNGNYAATYYGSVAAVPSFYQFATVSGGYYRIDLTAHSDDIDFYAFEKAGFEDSSIVCTSERYSTAPESCVVKATGAKLYFAVLNLTETRQRYYLSVKAVDAPAATGTDSEPVDLGTPPGSIESSVNTEASFYVVTGLLPSAKYTARLERLDGDADLYVTNGNFDEDFAAAIASGTACASTNSYTADESCELMTAGNQLRVLVDGTPAGAGATFTLTMTKTGTGSANEGSAGAPVSLTVGQERTSTVGTESFFRFNSTPGAIYDITATRGIVVHDDDGSYESTSSVCGTTGAAVRRCLIQASGTSVYLRAVASSGAGGELQLLAEEVDPELTVIRGTREVPLVLARGVSTYTSRIAKKTNSGDSSWYYYRLRTAPGAYYRVAVDSDYEFGGANVEDSYFPYDCHRALAKPIARLCAATAATTLLLVGIAEPHPESPSIIEVEIALQNEPAPIPEGTPEAPLELGAPTLIHETRLLRWEDNYYQLQVTPGVTYSAKGRSTQYMAFNSPHYHTVDAFLFNDLSNPYQGGDDLTATSDTMYLRVTPYSNMFGGPSEIVVTSHEDELPAEGVLGGPVNLGTVPLTYDGTVSVAYSLYTVETVPGQLYGVTFDASTSSGISAIAIAPNWSGHLCDERAGGECRFFAESASTVIMVTNGPAAFTLNVHPAVLPLNEGTLAAPYPLTGPVVHDGTVGRYGTSFYSITVPDAGEYVWWVTVTDGNVQANQRVDTSGPPYFCDGISTSLCPFTGPGSIPVTVRAGTVGGRFTLHVAPKP